jgi:hypothetical protein
MAATDTCDVCGQPIDLMDDKTTLRLGFLCDNNPSPHETRSTFGVVVTCGPVCALSPRILNRVNFDPGTWDVMVREHRRHVQTR